MAFQHLPHSRIIEIANAVEELPFAYDQATRATLFGGVPSSFVGLLPIIPVPKLQLRGDLARMNGVERLTNTTVPLLEWLTNAADLGDVLEPVKVLRRAADDVAHGTTGSPRVVSGDRTFTREVIIHRDDTVTFAFMEAGLAAAKAVARLEVPRFEAATKVIPGRNYSGTGWLITPHLLVTNHHVINARNALEPDSSEEDLGLQAQATTVKFDFDDDDATGTDFPVQNLEAWDTTLDYAILRLPETHRNALRVAPRVVDLPSPDDIIPLNVIQHPRGKSKRYGIRNNLLRDAPGTELHYFTDTDEGSSGSPVLDDAWAVVGLHRGADYVENVEFQGKSTAYVNLGTKIHSVIADIQARYPTVANELPV